MADLIFIKDINKPTTWKTDAVYYIQEDTYADHYVTSSEGVPYPVGNVELIQNVINNLGLTADGLIQPGYVTWSGTGLTFNVTPAIYIIDGVTYTSAAGSVTLDAADPDNPRLDVIAVDTTGAIVKITGTPAEDPTIPQIDPATQVQLTAILVPAGATIPDIDQNIVYDENVEAWTGTATGVTVNFNAGTPAHGSKAAFVSAWGGAAQINFTKNSGTVNTADVNLISLEIKLMGALTNGNIKVSFFNGATAVSNQVVLNTTYGFSKTLTANYQNVVIPATAFTFTGNVFNIVRFTLANSGGGFLLDYVQLQGGSSTLPPPVDTNFANADLVATGDRAHSWNYHYLTIQDLAQIDLEANDPAIVDRGIFVMNTSQTILSSGNNTTRKALLITKDRAAVTEIGGAYHDIVLSINQSGTTYYADTHGNVVLPAAVISPEIITFTTESIKTVAWDATRIAKFGAFPSLQVWSTSGATPQLITIPIAADAAPPSTAQFTFFLPGSPGFIVIK